MQDILNLLPIYFRLRDFLLRLNSISLFQQSYNTTIVGFDKITQIT